MAFGLADNHAESRGSLKLAGTVKSNLASRLLLSSSVSL
jgi:hypothetical protein